MLLCPIFGKTSENVSLLHIVSLSKDNVPSINQTKITTISVFWGLIWDCIGKFQVPPNETHVTFSLDMMGTSKSHICKIELKKVQDFGLCQF